MVGNRLELLKEYRNTRERTMGLSGIKSWSGEACGRIYIEGIEELKKKIPI